MVALPSLYSSSFLGFHDSLFLRSALNKLFSAIMVNTIQSVGRSLFNLISRALINPIHPLAASWLTIATPFPATKNPILIKFVISRRIRDVIYVGTSPGCPPHVSWVVNWPRKQAGGYIHIWYARPHLRFQSFELSRMVVILHSTLPPLRVPLSSRHSFPGGAAVLC